MLSHLEIRSPKILVIAYFFPPDSIGVRRLLANLKVWSEMGLEPIVLTCGRKRGAGHDADPLSDSVISNIPVFTAGSYDPYHLLEFWRPVIHNNSSGGKSATASDSGSSKKILDILRRHVWLPDDRMLWIGPAYRKALQILREYPSIEAVYTSNYPNSDHVIGMKVKQKTGIRWVADFRDGWVQNPAFFNPANKFIEKKQRLLEKKVCQTADKIVTVSPPITAHLQRHRKADQTEAVTITNGFDPVHFEEARKVIENEPDQESDVLRIVYAGTFFGRRHPRDFFRICGKLIQKHPEWKINLRISFFSSLSEKNIRYAKKCGLDSGNFELQSPVSFKECLIEQRRADVLLLVLEQGPGSEIMVSQKVFEYLAGKKPIYALVPEGAAATILRKIGGALIETSEVSSDSVERLNQFLINVKSGSVEMPEDEDLKPFHRKEQAEKIAELLLGSNSKTE